MLGAFHDGLDAFELDLRIEAAEENAITRTRKDEDQVGKTQFLLHISVFEFDDILVLLGLAALNHISLDGTAADHWPIPLAKCSNELPPNRLAKPAPLFPARLSITLEATSTAFS